MESELLTKKTYEQIEKYLALVLGESKMAVVAKEIKKLFPTWPHLWSYIQKWLQEHPMTNMQQTIHSFTQIFPMYESIASELDNALALHEDFWTQVHVNLCDAKDKLVC